MTLPARSRTESKLETHDALLHRLGALCIGALGSLIACGPAAESPTAVQRRICPSCLPLDRAGSETSDFSGDAEPCTGDLATLPTDSDTTSLLREVRAAYSGPFEATLRWEYAGYFEAGAPPAFWRAPPSGYEPVTRVVGNVVLGETEYFKGRPTLPDSTETCSNWFQVPASVELATEDGTFAGTANGAFVLGGNRVNVLRARLDLADAIGPLELHLEPTLAYTAELSFRMNIFPEGKRGELFVVVTRIEGNGTSTPPVAESSYVLSYPALAGTYPDDGCGSFGFPVAADAPLPAFGGQTASEVLSSWSAALESLPPVRGIRYDCVFGEDALDTEARGGVPVDLSFEIGAPQSVCSSSPSRARNAQGPFSFMFTSSGRITTPDDSLQVPLEGGAVGPSNLGLGIAAAEQIPLERFEARSGIRGVHPGNSPWLSYYGGAGFIRDQDTLTPSGNIAVRGVDCDSPLGCIGTSHMNARWPVDSPGTSLCQ